MKNNLRKSGRAASRSRKAKTEQSRLGHASPAGRGSCETSNAREPRVSARKNICRKEQGLAEPGNTCLTTPGTCESCPNHWNQVRASADVPEHLQVGPSFGKSDRDHIAEETAIQILSLRRALRDVLRFYDRAVGNVIDDSGYSVADMRRLEEIRALLMPYVRAVI